MKVIPKLLVFLLFLLVILQAAPAVSADIAFPECRWNELTVSCQCPHAYNACADNSCSQCEQYKNDSRYYYLWKDIYCRKASVFELAAKYKFSFVIPFITAVALQLTVFAVRGYRKKEELFKILPAIFLTMFFGMYLIRPDSLLNKGVQRIGLLSPLQNPAIHFSLYGMDLSRLVFLLTVAVLMVILEALFLVYIAKFGDRKKVLVTVIAAHFISLILGLGMLNAVYPHFLQPRIF